MELFMHVLELKQYNFKAFKAYSEVDGFFSGRENPEHKSFRRVLSLIFQLELFIFITYFSIVVPLTNCVFFPVGLSLLMWHFQQVL